MTEYMPLPKTKNIDNLSDDIPSTPIELSQSQLSQILTNMVRQKYFNFLEGLLADNYKNSASSDALSMTDIKKCAEYLEFKALRSCMIVSLYRQAILNIFTEIRNDTANKKLNVNLSTERIGQRKTRRSIQIQTDLTSAVVAELLSNQVKPRRKHLRNIRVQTDLNDSYVSESTEEMPMSLDERIRIFEKHFRDQDQQHNFSYCLPGKTIAEQLLLTKNRKRRHSLISLEMPSPHSSVDSAIQKSVERIDSHSSTENVALLTTNTSVETPLAEPKTPIDNGDNINDNIAQELEALFGNDDERDIFGETINPMDQSEPLMPIQSSDEYYLMESVDGGDSKFNDDSKETQHDYTQELRNSLWPCEMHMQRMRLNKILIENADKGIRYTEKLKRKFDDLFGPEDEYEDFAPYSPTIELDEILMSSCKKRVAPWIVKHLTPISDGLIEDRFLFKKVAKHIAEKVIIQDQYPSEHQIQQAINDFFKTHSYIGCIDDIT